MSDEMDLCKTDWCLNKDVYINRMVGVNFGSVDRMQSLQSCQFCIKSLFCFFIMARRVHMAAI